MSMEIVSRLLKSHRHNGYDIKESLSYKKLNEVDEDELSDDSEYEEFDNGDFDNDEEFEVEDNELEDFEEEDFSTDNHDDMNSNPPLSRSSRETNEDQYTDPDTIAEKPVEEKSNNPLDNNYSSKYTLGQEVSLTYSDGTASKLVGVIDGYDSEGFYRVKWGNGMTTSGITDIALADFIGSKGALKENKCVCGCKKFVTESNNLVCDRCGRVIKEFTDPLTKADRDRPKGKKLVRSEAHPINTAIGESIRKALNKKNYK